MRRRGVRLVAVVASAVVGAAVVACGSGDGPAQVRNVIFLVGDGMSGAHVTAARLRYHGARGRLNLERLPVLGAVSTYAVERGSDRPVVVTDSSSAATAWSSGVKTYNSAVGVDAHGNPVPTLMESAKAAGFATGNVTTAEVTDATPAAMVSHVLVRSCQGPDFTVEACLPQRADGTRAAPPEDRGSVTPIAEQIARRHTADVVLGGGLARFEPEDEKALRDGGYEVLGSFGDPALDAQTARSQRPATGDELAATGAGKVIGLFNRGNLTVESARAAGDREPTLAEMTRKSLSLLSGRAGSPGFFLQVEGAQIDKRSHADDPDHALGEVKGFDDAVAAAVEFAERDGHTLVVVTADHECSGFAVVEPGVLTNAEAAAPPGNEDEGNPANSGTPARDPAANTPDPARAGIANAPGASPRAFGPATFRTPDDPADVTDGSPRASLWVTAVSAAHTGADVPLRAFGPTSERYATGQDNTDLHHKIRAALLGSG